MGGTTSRFIPVDGTGKIDGRGKSPNSLANLKAPWSPGQSGGGGAAGGHQTARWRKAINEAVTENDCIDVIQAMNAGACGVVMVRADRDGTTTTYMKAPDPAAARLFFEVLRIIGPDAAQVDLKDAPDEVLKWLEANGKGN